MFAIGRPGARVPRLSGVERGIATHVIRDITLAPDWEGEGPQRLRWRRSIVINSRCSTQPPTLLGDWWLSETHVAISVQASCPEGDPSGVPAKNGNPTPGKFPYKETHNPLVQSYTYTIPIPDDYDSGDWVCFATHAVVVKKDGNTIVDTQTGWAGNRDFSGKNWAKFFCYRPAKVLELPDKVTATISHKGGQYDCDGWDSYWHVAVTSGGSGDLPNSGSDGYYLGWCIDRTTTITSGEHDFSVIPYYDTDNLPSDEKNNDWARINYILNNKGSYSATVIQNAIWYFTGDTNNYNSNSQTKALVDDALANGGDFVPGPGDWMAVLLQYDGNQSIIIEVDP